MRTRRALTFTTIICSLLVITSSLADDNSRPKITLKETVVLLSQPPPLPNKSTHRRSPTLSPVAHTSTWC